jgi:hypothetical protein
MKCLLSTLLGVVTLFADKRPVWIARPDGSDARVLEPLRYQMSIDGSRSRGSRGLAKEFGQGTEDLFRTPPCPR